MSYPSKKLIVETLLETAARVGQESNAKHPEDFAAAMSLAIENAGVVLDILSKSNSLKD